MKLEPEYIEKLAKIITDNGLTEISMEDGEQAITIRKDLPEVMLTSAPSAPMQQSVAQPVVNTQETIVGTFYTASAPDAAPFVEIGSEIAVGDVVCIIEAMKLMNEIKSEQAGKVVQICVKNGDPVEFGQVLMYVE